VRDAPLAQFAAAGADAAGARPLNGLLLAQRRAQPQALQRGRSLRECLPAASEKSVRRAMPAITDELVTDQSGDKTGPRDRGSVSATPRRRGSATRVGARA
jgi:hypothetical protein